MTQAPINVWNEVRITSEGISISLLSESAEGGAVVEDETWFTFAEMQAQSPSAPISLNLSEETKESLLSDDSQQSAESQVSNLPGLGTLVRDTNPPSWSDGDHLRVVGHPDERADEYPVENRTIGCDTVADANPSCDPDERVVECIYESEMVEGQEPANEEDIYAFPESRVEIVSPKEYNMFDGSQKDWHEEYGN